jgi:hypothetical protein
LIGANVGDGAFDPISHAADISDQGLIAEHAVVRFAG